MDLDCLSAPVTKVRVDAIGCVSFCEVHYSEERGGGGGGKGSLRNQLSTSFRTLYCNSAAEGRRSCILEAIDS